MDGTLHGRDRVAHLPFTLQEGDAFFPGRDIAGILLERSPWLQALGFLSRDQAARFMVIEKVARHAFPCIGSPARLTTYVAAGARGLAGSKEPPAGC